MPNTLAHIGLQGPLMRVGIPGVDPKWVFLGLLIPDLPWILQRLLQFAWVTGDGLYTARLYTIAQSSLVMCGVLALGVAMISAAPVRIFVVLFLNCTLHLLLDALQIKLANGVHFLAPLSWRLINIGVVWPEHPLTWIASGAGLAFAVLIIVRPGPTSIGFRPTPASTLVAVGLLAVYLLLPVAMIEGVRKADNHFVRTLERRADRPGRRVEFDRNRLVSIDHEARLITFAEESLLLKNVRGIPDATVSIRGHFVDAQTVEVELIHVHASQIRDVSSYVGLICVAASWVAWGLRQRRNTFAKRS